MPPIPNFREYLVRQQSVAEYRADVLRQLDQAYTLVRDSPVERVFLLKHAWGGRHSALKLSGSTTPWLSFTSDLLGCGAVRERNIQVAMLKMVDQSLSVLSGLQEEGLKLIHDIPVLFELMQLLSHLRLKWDPADIDVLHTANYPSALLRLFFWTSHTTLSGPDSDILAYLAEYLHRHAWMLFCSLLLQAGKAEPWPRDRLYEGVVETLGTLFSSSQ